MKFLFGFGMTLSSKIRHFREFGGRALRYRLRALLTSRPREGHVLMVHTGRAGSTVLAKMLDQHSRICWDGEIFEKQLHRIAEVENCKFNSFYGRFALDDLVLEFERRMKLLCGSRIFGAEIQDYHLEMVGGSLSDLIARLRLLGFTRFIVLERSNTLRRVVSSVVATQRSTFHVAKSEKVQNPTVSIDPDRVYLCHRYTRLVDSLDASRRFLDDARAQLRNEPLLELYYERDIEEDPRKAHEMICRFLDLAPEESEVTLGRTTPQPLHATLENYDEISALLADTDHAWMAPPRSDLTS